MSCFRDSIPKFVLYFFLMYNRLLSLRSDFHHVSSGLRFELLCPQMNTFPYRQQKVRVSLIYTYLTFSATYPKSLESNSPKIPNYAVSIFVISFLMLDYNHLDNSTTASITLSPLFELVSRNMALWSLAIRAPSSKDTHALRLTQEVSLNASRRSVLFPHNMIGIRFSATS